MTTGKLLALVTALASVAAVSTFWAVSRAPAAPMGQVASGLVGLTTGEVLALGQAFSCQFDVPVGTEGRHEVHAVVGLGGRSDDVVATLEVLDLDTGQSRMGWQNHNETLVHDPAASDAL